MQRTRVFHFFLVLFILVLGASVMYAQQGDPPYDLVLSELSTRLGRTVRLADLASYNWQQRVFDNTNLGCAGRTGSAVAISGYLVQVKYQLVEYDYRVSFDRTTVFLCSSISFIPTATPTFTPSATPSISATPTRTLTPTITMTPSTTFTPTLTPTPTNTPRREAISCPGFMPTRLWYGELGRVTPDGDPNRLRDQPSVDGEQLFLIPPGGVFSILEGPECDGDGRAWWRVDYVGRIGWTAEGDGQTYFTEPIAPTATPTFMPIVTETPTARLRLDQAFATNTPRL